MEHHAMRLQAGAVSHTGHVRQTNEDAVGVFKRLRSPLWRGLPPLFVLADGMGGHQSGEVASHLAVNTARSAFVREVKGALPPDALCRAVMAANQVVHARATSAEALAGMGTTLVAATMDRQSLYVASVGDSRAYRVSGKAVHLLTHDHSLAAERERLGLASAEELECGAGRNVLTRSIGRSDSVEVDLVEAPWLPGDVLVLCSDGLWGFVTEEQMQEAVQPLAPQAAAHQLIEMALANQSTDNVSAVVVRRVR